MQSAPQWNIATTGFLPSRPPSKWLCFELGVFDSLCESIPEYFGYGDSNQQVQGPLAFVNAVKSLPSIDLCLSMQEVMDSPNPPPGPRSRPTVIVDVAEQKERAFAVLSFLANAYVRATEMLSGDSGKPTEPIQIPQVLSIPLVKLARALGREPIVDYASSVLTNWELKDPSMPLSFENINILTTFTHLPSEAWFYKTHIVIEHHGATVVRLMQEIGKEMDRMSASNAVVPGSPKESLSMVPRLKEMAVAMGQMNVAMKRMTEGCKDVDFFDKIRPWLASWPSCGVVYLGVDDSKVVHLNGASGAQSSLLPCIDAFMGINYNASSATTTSTASLSEAQKFKDQIKSYRKHMPPPHRELLEQFESKFVDQGGNMRCFVDKLAEQLHQNNNADNPQTDEASHIPLVLSEMKRINSAQGSNSINRLKGAYNECINCMISFRRLHAGFASRYIASIAKRRAREAAAKREASAPAGPKMENGGVKGTGGSSFTTHLMAHITKTRKCLYDIPQLKEEAVSRRRQEESYVLPGLGRQLPGNTVFGKKHNLE